MPSAGADGKGEAAEAGVASIEHGSILGEEEFALMKKHNVALVSTDFTVKSLQALGYPVDQGRRIHELRVAKLKRAYQAGVTIVFGTDVMGELTRETRGTLAIGYIDGSPKPGCQIKKFCVQ